MDSTITPRQFIEAWQGSSAVAEVAQKLRMKKNQVRVRACRYRQRGVPLKEYVPAELPVVDWPGLAQYATQLLAAGEEGAQPSAGASPEPATGLAPTGPESPESQA